MRRVMLVSLCCLAAAGMILAGCGSGSRSETAAPSRVTVGGGIQPGVGLGTLALGATYAEAVALLGAPAAPEGSAQGAASGLVEVSWPARGIAASFADTDLNGFADATEKAVLLTVGDAGAPEGGVFASAKHLAGLSGFQAFTGLTGESLGLGKSKDAVRAAYGTPDAGQTVGDWYAARGVGFAYSDAGAATAACVFAPQAETADAVAPGDGIGALRVNGAFGAVTAYGVPETTRSEMTDETAVMYAWWPERGVWGVFNDLNRDGILDAGEKCIMATAAAPYAGRTAEGLGMGSTKAQVRQALGTPTEEQEGGDYYLTLGVAFEYDARGFVVGMRAFGPYLAAAAANTKIQPGAGIGGIRVNATFGQATAAYGPPANVRSKASQGPPVVLASWPSVGLFALVADSNSDGAAAADEKVVMVLSASPYAGKTAEGVGMGSLREKVGAALGMHDRRSNLDIFPALGVVFAYTDQDEVMSVAVFRPQAGGAADQILEGRAVGAVWVGATYGAAQSRYDKPSLLVPYQDPDQAVVYAYWQDRGLMGIYDDADKNGEVSVGERCVLAYAAKPFAGQTILGVGMDSTKEQVHQIHGEPEEVEGETVDWYWSKGVVFNYTDAGAVWNVGVFAPFLEGDDPNIPKRIQPGVGVGSFLVGMTLADIKAIYGDPAKAIVVKVPDRGVVLGIWQASISATFVDANGNGAIDGGEKCDMVWARAPYSGATDEGITTLVPRAQVYNAFGTPEQVQDATTDWYWSKGLVVNYTTDDKVLSIGVYKPGSGADETLLAQGKASEARSRAAAGRSTAALWRVLNRR